MLETNADKKLERRTSIEMRELIMPHFLTAVSQRKIAQIVTKSASIVQHIIEPYDKENRVHNKD